MNCCHDCTFKIAFLIGSIIILFLISRMFYLQIMTELKKDFQNNNTHDKNKSFDKPFLYKKEYKGPKMKRNNKYKNKYKESKMKRNNKYEKEYKEPKMNCDVPELLQLSNERTVSDECLAEGFAKDSAYGDAFSTNGVNNN